MNRASQAVMRTWVGMGTRFLPFADAATPDLPLPRLLRLSLFQVSVGMALVLLVGTLNRVMIVELKVPASLVGVMISLPLLFAPFRALIGFRSDTHQSALGWRRVPFIFRGAMVQFGGLAMMPFALLVLAGQGNAATAPAWVGDVAGAMAFLLVGAGLHTTQTVGLALATDLAPTESQPKVVGLMYVMLLFGMISSALLFGALLADFTPGRLVQVVQGAAVATLVFNGIALWKQEGRNRARALAAAAQHTPGFREAWESFTYGGQVTRRLTAVGLGTMGFSMEDVLLEPYGGQILHLSVGDTTKLTATLAIGGLFGFGLASRVLSRGFDPFRMAGYGALVGIPAFAAVILAAPASSAFLFGLGTLLVGFGAGLFGHGTLTATMNLAPKNQTGLALGAWGAVQASAAGLAIALGGIIRDLVAGVVSQGERGAAMAYDCVYGIEIVLLFATLLTMLPLIQHAVAYAGAGRLTEASPAVGTSRARGDKMSDVITRLFGTQADATGAVAALRQRGLSSDTIFVVGPSDDHGGESLEAAIMKAYVWKGDAKKYADGVRKGGTVVTIHPQWGLAVAATNILDSFNPIDAGIHKEEGDGPTWDEAAPLSSSLGLPVLIESKSTATSVISTGPYKPTIPLPTLTGSNGAYKGVIPLPLLSGEHGSYKGVVPLPLLSGGEGSYKPVIPLPLLTRS